MIGATDINRKKKSGGAIRVTLFGETAHLPSWPARFSAHLRIPILPGTAALEGDRFGCHLADPILEEDLARATQAWADAFETFFRRWPEDWAFLYDKRWSALVGRAAANGAPPAASDRRATLARLGVRQG